MKDLKNRFDVLATGAEDATTSLRDVRDAARDFGNQLDAMRGAMDHAAAAFSGGGGTGTAAVSVAAPTAEESGFGALAGQLAAMGGRIGSSLKAAFTPMQAAAAGLNTSVGQIAHTVDVAAGAFVTFARRVDASMKITPIQAFWTWLKNEVPGTLGANVAEAALSARKMGMLFRNMGDVAGKSLSQLEARGRITALGLVRAFATLKPAMAAGVAGGIVSAFVRLAPTALAATKALLGFTNAGLRLMGISPYRVISLMINPLKLAGVFLRGTTSGMSAFTRITSAATGPIRNFGRELSMAMGFFGLAYKVVDFFKSGVMGAMSLGETMNKVDQTFGQSAGTITALGNEMAKSYGIGKRELLDAASAFGLIAQGAGAAEGPAAQLSAQLTRMAVDTKSLFAVPMEQVLEDFRSALVGQSEPMRKYGVLLSEEAVGLEAVRLGLARSTKTVNDWAKVQARASIMARGLAPAMGDQARTADSAYNQFTKAGGGLQNFADAIGTVLMPATQQAVSAFNQLLASIVETFEANKPLIESWGAAITEVFSGLGVFVRNMGTYWQMAQLQVGAFVENAVRTLATIPENAAQYASYFFNNWKKVLADLAQVWLSFYGDLAKNAKNFAVAIWSYLKNPTQGFNFQFDFTNLTDSFKQATEQLPELIKPQLVNVQDQIDKLQAGIVDKETKRLLEAKPPAERGKRPAPITGEEDKDKGKRGHVETAGALELGSREAASAIARHVNGPAQSALKESREQTKLQRQMVQQLKANPRAAKGDPNGQNLVMANPIR